MCFGGVEGAFAECERDEGAAAGEGESEFEGEESVKGDGGWGEG